jgi:hypothetical protein
LILPSKNTNSAPEPIGRLVGFVSLRLDEARSLARSSMAPPPQTAELNAAEKLLQEING